MRSLLLAVLLPVAALSQEPAPAGIPMAQVHGRYEFNERGMSATADLRADGSFTYRIDGAATDYEPARVIRWDGAWQTHGANEIVLENAPGPPPRLVQTAAVRDPSVRAAVTIVGPAERVESEIALIVDEAWPSEEMSEGRWIRPLLAPSGRRRVATKSPRRPRFPYTPQSARGAVTLADIRLTPGGPNRFTFTYTPAPITPFSLRGMVTDPQAGTIELELGQVGLPMRRTGPARPPS